MVPRQPNASLGASPDRSAGLRLVAGEDLNGKIRRNWEFGYERAVETARDATPARIARLLCKGAPPGAEGVRLVKEQFAAALHVNAGFYTGFLRYT